MKVILNRDIKNIGRKGEVKEVPDGYARNLLIPQGAVRAVDARGAQQATKQHERELAQKDEREHELIATLKELCTQPLTLSAKANAQGHLFVGIKEKDILTALAQAGVSEHAHITLTLEHPIKELGEHAAHVRVGKWKGELRLAVVGA